MMPSRPGHFTLLYTLDGASPQLHLHGSGSGRSLTRMRYSSVSSLLGGALLSLAAFAHASPPDETWQPGVYDDADFDDVIDLIVSLSVATADSSPRISRRAPAVAAALVAIEPGDLPPRLLLFRTTTRSPPSPRVRLTF